MNLGENILIAVVFATYIAIAAFFVVFKLNYFQITDIKVVGAKNSSEAELLRRAGIRAGYTNIFFSTNKLKMQILKNPWITDVNVRKEYPRKVIIEVTEQSPFCLLIDHKGDMYYLSKKGVILAEANFSNGLDFPVLISKGIESQQLIKNAVQVLSLSASSNVLSWEEISEINIDPVYGLKVFTKDKRRIDFGKGDIRTKWKNVEKIITHSITINMKEKYIHIDRATMGVVGFNL
ncbi:MAG: FtsQ-type POTRA domain-containing protein [Thermodesulfobacteriota bacterium]